MDGCHETCHRCLRVNTAINAANFICYKHCIFVCSIDCIQELLAQGALVGSGKWKATGKKKIFLIPVTAFGNRWWPSWQHVYNKEDKLKAKSFPTTVILQVFRFLCVCIRVCGQNPNPQMLMRKQGWETKQQGKIQAWPVMALKCVNENEVAQQHVGTAAGRWDFCKEKPGW